jgi:hypothetical protein
LEELKATITRRAAILPGLVAEAKLFDPAPAHILESFGSGASSDFSLEGTCLHGFSI